MMHLIEILTALTLGGGLLAGGFKAMSKLTRLVDAVESLSEAMHAVVGQVGDHETRLTRIEDRFADLHDDVRAGRKGVDGTGARAPRRTPKTLL